MTKRSKQKGSGSGYGGLKVFHQPSGSVRLNKTLLRYFIIFVKATTYKVIACRKETRHLFTLEYQG